MTTNNFNKQKTKPVFSFLTKKIKNQNSIGETLKQARYKTGLSLNIVAKHTGINAKYLKALEEEDWHELPGVVYAKNFINKYVDFLKIDTKKINFNIDSVKFSEPKKDFSFRKKSKAQDFLNLPHTLKISLIILIIVMVVVYVIWQIKNVTHAPNVNIFYPPTEISTTHNELTVWGWAEAETKIKINNQEVLLDKQLEFRHIIRLLPNLNIVTITGKKKHSKTKTIELRVIYNQQSNND